MARYQKKPKTKFSKKIVTLCIMLVVIFTPLFIYAFIKVGSEPIAIVGAFYGFITAELFKLADLKKDENKKKKEEDLSGD